MKNFVQDLWDELSVLIYGKCNTSMIPEYLDRIADTNALHFVALGRAAWQAYRENGNDTWYLQSYPLALLIRDMVYYFPASDTGFAKGGIRIFGTWMAQAVTGLLTEGEDDELIRNLNDVAAQAAIGRACAFAYAFQDKEWWTVYQPGVQAVLNACRNFAEVL